MDQLLSFDDEIREKALGLLPEDVRGTAELIQQSPPSFEASRTVAMHIRRLSNCKHPAVVHFLYGLLGRNFTPTWEVIYDALANIGTDEVSDIALRWLDEQRSHALRVLAKIDIERHARQIVQYLEADWPRREKIQLLDLFGKLKNPRGLPKPDSVYQLLMRNLSSGDAAVQKSALRALFTWKTVRPHEETLMNLLDDGRHELPSENIGKMVVPILFGRSSKRRMPILQALTSFKEEDIHDWISLALTEDERRQSGMLHMIDDMVKVWGVQFAPYMDRVAEPVVKLAGERQGMKVLLSITRVPYDWTILLPTLYEVMSPKLEKFAVENSEGVSSLMQIFGEWAQSHPEWITDEVAEQLMQCLISGKRSVRLFCIDVWRHLIVDRLQYAEQFLTNLLAIIDDVLEAAVEAVFELAPHLSESSQALRLLETCAHLLGQPSNTVNERTKNHVLDIVLRFWPMAPDPSVKDKLLNRIESAFGYWRGRESRDRLCEVVKVLTGEDLFELNAYNGLEPDFDRRLAAFAQIETMSRAMVHNMFFFMGDEEELAIRSHASACLNKYMTTASEEQIKEIWPRLKTGATAKSEIIRVEYMQVIGTLVEKRELPFTADLKPLLHTDEESSFFNNILHIQQHRRVRAIHRLAEVDINQNAAFMISVLERFLDDDHNVANEAIQAIGILSARLKWHQLERLMMGYLRRLDKTTLRLARAIIDNLPEGPVEKFLPPLTRYLHEKDETTVSQRVPVAVSVVKLIKRTGKVDELLPPVLTDICHILRSRDQIARDMTCKTLTEISDLLGPDCLGFIVKELRGALKRGYQLHVLAYTVHSILGQWPIGSIDYCISDIMDIVINDTYGSIGQEKDADGYHSSMREVKSRKSPDTVERIASMASTQRLGDIVKPLNLRGSLAALRKTEELLQRVANGMLKRPEPEMFMFCYEVIPSRPKFGLDLIRNLVKNPEYMQPKYLDGFMPLIGDSLQGSQEVQIAAIRVLTQIVKCPLETLERDMKAFVATAVTAIKTSPTTNSELAQASLKFLTAVLKEREIKEGAISYLLNRIKPDLEEPEMQSIAFNFLRAVMNRKVMVPEIYDVMDTVRGIMVTNHSRAVRDLARGAYLQFIMDYPQGKQRFAHQLSFLGKNLDYEHKEGRQSVMEALHLLLGKVGGDLQQQLLRNFFVPLVLRMANDEPDCREMAATLLAEIFEKADEATLATLMAQVKAWMDTQKVIALQCYAIHPDPYLFECIDDVLEDEDWNTLYVALQTMLKLQTYSDKVFDKLSFPHAWVRLAAARLVGQYFTNGLVQKERFEMLTRRFLSILGSDISDDLANQTIKNLVYLGRNGQQVLETTSKIIRGDSSNKTKTTCLKLLAALCSVLEDLPLEHVVHPIYNLTDPSIPQDEELSNMAQEIAKLVQKKVGTAEYIAVYQTIREQAKRTREERRAKRRIDAVTNPVLSEQMKRRKHERSKVRRREKSMSFRDRRRGVAL